MLRLLSRIVALFTLLAPIAAVNAQADSFVYQGRLDQGGTPVTGTYDLRFSLFAAASGGTALAGPSCADNIAVANGLFAVEVPLTLPTSGADTWLEIQTRADTGLSCTNTSGFVTLSPRIKLAPAPKAVFASAVPQTSPTIPGALRFNPTLRRFEGSDGLFWYPLTAGSAILPANIQDFATPGTFNINVPADISRIGVDIIGAGGGGGGRGSGLDSPTSGSCNSGTPGYATGGGGGGGGGSGRFSIDVTPGEVLTIQIGNGGIPGGIASPGAPGQVTSIRRGSTTIVSAPGGQGGGGGINVVMGATSTSGCLTPVGTSVPGGTAGAAPTLAGSGSLVSSAAGNLGSSGFGPSCATAGGLPPTVTRCPAVGGAGAPEGVLGAQLPLIGAGNGGQGGANATASTAGGPGRVRLFWN